MRNILSKLTISLSIVFTLTWSGCEHDSLIDSVCGYKDPTENIPWMKALINSNNQNKDLQSLELFNYKSNQLIVTYWKSIGIEDSPIGAIYNCNGDLLYSCGGNQPVDSCTYILSKSEFVGYIWTKK